MNAEAAFLRAIEADLADPAPIEEEAERVGEPQPPADQEEPA